MKKYSDVTLKLLFKANLFIIWGMLMFKNMQSWMLLVTDAFLSPISNYLSSYSFVINFRGEKKKSYLENLGIYFLRKIKINIFHLDLNYIIFSV